MFRILLSLILLVLSSSSSSSARGNDNVSLYQIDLIILTHPYTFPYVSSPNVSIPLKIPALSRQGVSLSPSHENSTEASPEMLYHLLSPSRSQLKEAAHILNGDAEYQLLLHYSWLQSVMDQKPIMVEDGQSGRWEVKGTIAIRKNNYYLFESDLLFSSLEENENKTIFSFQQKQYLKADSLYYLDHPQAGVLIKIHPILS